jgi:hypothetical protein
LIASPSSDRAAVAELPGPVAELVPAITTGVGSHPGQQAVAGEGFEQHGRCHRRVVEVERRRHLARMGEQSRCRHRRRLDR